MLSLIDSSAPIGDVRARAYTIATDKPEADGTIAWDSTTLVLCEVEAGGETGLGFTYSHRINADLIAGLLATTIEGRSAMDVGACTRAMQVAVRNLGRDGIAATAISAVDLALWDLKSKLLRQPLVMLLGALRDSIPIYGSGGFTTYSDAELADQLGGWVRDEGCQFVKMKIGTNPADDPQRMRVAKEAIGDAILFIDANGAFVPREAIAMAERAAAFGVAWFEEPVSGDDLDGLGRVRARAPDGMDIAAGEYSLRSRQRAADARSGRGGCAAGRRDPLRRRHRLPCGRNFVRCPPYAAVGSLRTFDASARRLGGAAASALGMVSRPCSHRTHAVRRLCASAEWKDFRRPEPARTRPRLQSKRRGALSCLTFGKAKRMRARAVRCWRSVRWALGSEP